MASKEPLTSKKYVDGIYIPAGLLVFGTYICKKEWLPYAIALALALSVFKFLRTRKSIHSSPASTAEKEEEEEETTKRRTNQADDHLSQSPSRP